MQYFDGFLKYLYDFPSITYIQHNRSKYSPPKLDTSKNYPSKSGTIPKNIPREKN